VNKQSARDQKRDMFRRPSQLFLLRIWLGETGESKGSEDWNGKVQHTVTGEAHYFHGCSELVRVLRRMMPRSEVDQDSVIGGDNEQEDRS
jgi:hypothetical protein